MISIRSNARYLTERETALSRERLLYQKINYEIGPSSLRTCRRRHRTEPGLFWQGECLHHGIKFIHFHTNRMWWQRMQLLCWVQFFRHVTIINDFGHCIILNCVDCGKISHIRKCSTVLYLVAVASSNENGHKSFRNWKRKLYFSLTWSFVALYLFRTTRLSYLFTLQT